MYCYQKMHKMFLLIVQSTLKTNEQICVTSVNATTVICLHVYYLRNNVAEFISFGFVGCRIRGAFKVPLGVKDITAT